MKANSDSVIKEDRFLICLQPMKSNCKVLFATHALLDLKEANKLQRELIEKLFQLTHVAIKTFPFLKRIDKREFEKLSLIVDRK